MPTLRIIHSITEDAFHLVELTLEDGERRDHGINRFSFSFSQDDRELVRWYLEDYLEFPVDPAPTLAARAEERLAAVGADLFDHVFAGDAARLWARLRPALADARVEIAGDAVSLPLELLRDPDSDIVVALGARSFVRASLAPRDDRIRLKADESPLRVLVVIARPGGAADVPFRSVASHLLRVGAQSGRLRFDVLRPPTWARLEEAVRVAHRDGAPYQVVHFDGHGTYADLSPEQSGRRGYVVFEGADPHVEGRRLGELLAANDTSLLVLNACRSAHAEARTAPDEDVDATAHAYGSLAEEVAEAGVPGVVAMRYNVFVDTAAAFVDQLYRSLLQGVELGQAVTNARRWLAAQPTRTIAYQPRPLQDWIVPVVYEARPLVVAAPGEGADEALLPSAAVVGFFGRDGTLLTLDRAFDSRSIVLITGYAGAGKTSTSEEFGRWYERTGGTDIVLWTSFDHRPTLAKMLAQVAVLGEETTATRWSQMSTEEQRTEALRLLGRRRVLWLWDNVELVAGFPTARSFWSEREQKELADFLRDIEGTTTKVLLTSRRDERPWLGELPVRVELPPMPMRERVQLAGAVAATHGHQLGDVEDWRPLLRYTEGNPLTLSLVVSQALRQRVRSADDIRSFVERLRTGESLVDDEREGRARSLGASLRYGFDQAFDESERPYVALLHLFQGFVNVRALVSMTATLDEPGSPFVALGHKQWMRMSDRAASVGLVSTAGEGYYRVHPALAWFLAPAFDAVFGGDGERARLAYAGAMADLGEAYHRAYESGRGEVVPILYGDEANLLHARHMALAAGWWEEVLGAMQALADLYLHAGRTVEWARLVDEVEPLFVDPRTGEPRPDREEGWGIVAKYRVRLAQWDRNFDESERLLRIRIDADRRRAAAALAARPGALTDVHRHQLRALSVSLHELAETLRKRESAACTGPYREAIELAHRAGERTGESVATYNLASAFLEIREMQDLDEAECLYRHSLTLLDDSDMHRNALTIAQLGHLALARYNEAKAQGASDETLTRLLDEMMELYEAAGTGLPKDATRWGAELHNQLGIVYGERGEFDVALDHFQRAIALDEQSDHRFGAGLSRFNVALLLMRAGRPEVALPYAQSALHDFQSLGTGAATNAEEARALTAILEDWVRVRSFEND